MEAIVDFLNVFISEASRFSVTISLFLIFLGLLYWYSVYPFSVLSRCGIKHPKPVPFFGNMFMFRQGFFKRMSDLIKTHGRVCVYYLGRRPVVVVADPDMLRQVRVSDFSSFPNRVTIPLASKPMTDCLFLLRNERWKRVRSIVSPSFSAAKLKEMVPLINTATDALMKNLNVHAESGEAFDIHRCFGCFTMDVIASVAFATQAHHINDPEHWPEPEKFIPERFTPEAKANRHPFVYLPFGAGPCNCVGMRLAQLEIKMALVHLFHRFSIVACSETKVPLELKTLRTLGPTNDIFVKIARRDIGQGEASSPSDD